jgi:hypothetical protein
MGVGKLKYRLIWCGAFAVAMGYFEAALVEYLRALYYPEGFAFPLRDIPARMLRIEAGREVASLLMLAAVGILAGRGLMDRFAGVAYCFGVWDLTYYLFLELFEGWPPSLMTEDLLFLVPWPWVGPVWAAAGVSLALIGAAIAIWRLIDRGQVQVVRWWEWALEGATGGLIIGSFLARSPSVIRREPAPPFPWYVWLAGMALGIGVFARNLKRAGKIE